MHTVLSAGEIIFNKSPPQDQSGASKNQVKSEEDKFNELIKKTQQVLLKISTIFPFDLFPDDVIVDEEDIYIITREFFGSEQISSIHIKDIQDVTVETIPFFATLKIIDKKYKDQPFSIKFLKRDDAIKARRLIHGLAEATDQGINFAKLSPQYLIKKVEELDKGI